METKVQIRKRLLSLRNEIPPHICESSAKEILHILKTHPKITEHGYLYAYYPHGKELSLLPFLEWALNAGKRVALPKTDNNTMDFYEITDLSQVTTGAFGVQEPVNTRKVAWEEAVCLIPGVGFTTDGKRIGHGKAFYDRYLTEHPRLCKIGICHEIQLLSELPTEPTDIPMEYLVTPKRRIQCHAPGERSLL